MQRRHRIRYVAAAVVVVVSMVMPTMAWAKYRFAGSETNTFATLTVGISGRPTCSGLGILSLTLSWTAANNALRYDLGEDNSSGGPYSYSNVGNVTSVSFSISSGNHFYVVRAANHNWQGIDSAERKVVGVLGLLATCPGP